MEEVSQAMSGSRRAGPRRILKRDRCHHADGLDRQRMAKALPDRRSDGGAAEERRQGSRAGEGRQAHQEAAQGVERTERNADADRGQEAQGGCREEVFGQAAAEVSVGRVRNMRRRYSLL
jgi:hypothetical protein